MISLATYLSARRRLIDDVLWYRQWIKSDPAGQWCARLKTAQRQLLQLRQAERLPMLAQGAGTYL